MKAVSKIFYRRQSYTKNTITTIKDENGNYFYIFESLWLRDSSVKDVQPSSVKIKDFKGKSLWRIEVCLSEQTVSALHIAAINKENFENKTVKMRLK